MSSEMIVFSICMLLLALLLGLLVGILIVYLRDETFGRKIETIPVIRSAPTTITRCWRIELQNTYTGQFYIKNFVGQIILGRSTTSEELFWKMKVGDDPSISREQCVVYDIGGVLVIENLSQANITLMNGYPLTQPRALQIGDRIVLGRSNLIISAMERLL